MGDLLNMPTDHVWMRAIQVRSMFDQCLLVTHTTSAGAYNEPVATYTAGAEPVACGYNPGPGRYAMGSSQVITYDAVVRLPYGTAIDERGGLIIVAQSGQAITPLSFEFVGPIEYGATAITARCAIVTDGRF